MNTTAFDILKTQLTGKSITIGGYPAEAVIFPVDNQEVISIEWAYRDDQRAAYIHASNIDSVKVNAAGGLTLKYDGDTRLDIAISNPTIDAKAEQLQALASTPPTTKNFAALKQAVQASAVVLIDEEHVSSPVVSDDAIAFNVAGEDSEPYEYRLTPDNVHTLEFKEKSASIEVRDAEGFLTTLTFLAPQSDIVVDAAQLLVRLSLGHKPTIDLIEALKASPFMVDGVMNVDSFTINGMPTTITPGDDESLVIEHRSGITTIFPGGTIKKTVGGETIDIVIKDILRDDEWGGVVIVGECQGEEGVIELNTSGSDLYEEVFGELYIDSLPVYNQEEDDTPGPR